jgi:hypothetical protein
MKCFHCRQKIEDERESVHIGDGDHVHRECKIKYESARDRWWANLKDPQWYKRWLAGDVA